MKAQVMQLLKTQLLVTAIYPALIALTAWGDILSALVGCLASLLPSTYFGIRMLKQADNNNAEQWLGFAYRADIGKWILAGIIFALAFTSGYRWDPIVLFAGYLLTQMSGMFLPIIQKGK